MIGADEVESAARRLAGIALRTPLIRNDELDRVAGGTVLVKAENLQRTGSFKIRGAYNLMSRLTAEQGAAGVVAFSSGNHAQGVALAGRLLGIRTTIVMPSDAPRAKLDNTRRLGGEVITYDRRTQDREVIARELAAQRGAVVVPAYDDPRIIAGQGTVGLEIAEQCAEYAAAPDQALINCGGGGLSAGSGIALAARFPDIELHTVEPEAFDDTARSLAAGRRERIRAGGESICDALLADMPGRLTFEVLSRHYGPGITVSDDDVREAMRFAFRNLKLVVEPGGAAALAAVLRGKVDTAGRTTAIVLSGGNVDVDRYAAIQQES